MTYAEWQTMQTGQHWTYRAEAERQHGEVVHVGQHGYIRRVGKVFGLAVYQITRATAPDAVIDGELVRGKDAAMVLVA